MTLQPLQQPPEWLPSEVCAASAAPKGPAPLVARPAPGLPTACSLLYLRMSRTKLEKASSTLTRCLADASMKRQPKCLASSRPSAMQ